MKKIFNNARMLMGLSAVVALSPIGFIGSVEAANCSSLNESSCTVTAGCRRCGNGCRSAVDSTENCFSSHLVPTECGKTYLNSYCKAQNRSEKECCEKNNCVWNSNENKCTERGIIDHDPITIDKECSSYNIILPLENYISGPSEYTIGTDSYTKWTFVTGCHIDELRSCEFACNCGYHKEEEKEGSKTKYSCLENQCSTPLPENAILNYTGIGGVLPGTNDKDRAYDTDGTKAACTFVCDGDHEYNTESKKCVSKSVPNKGKRFEPRKTTATTEKRYLNEKKLTETGWNDLMDELDNIDGLIEELMQFKLDQQAINNEQQAINQYSVPAGTIMAFYLKKCPEGWSLFTGANGRFLMGMNENGSLGGKGGTGGITLDANQLPEHHHYMFANKKTPNSNNEWHLLSKYGAPDKRFVAKTSEEQLPYFMGTYYASDKRHEPADIVYERNYENDVRLGLTSSQLVDTGGSDISQESIDILNPYIRVLYCIKGAVKPRINVANRTSSAGTHIDIIENGPAIASVNQINLAVGMSGTYTLNPITPVVPGVHNIEVWMSSRRCTLRYGGNPFLIDEEGWIGGHDENGQGFLWTCANG